MYTDGFIDVVDTVTTNLANATISAIFFQEKINFLKIIGLISCLIGVFAIIIKGDLNLLINLNFTIGDLWMLAAAIGWAVYSTYLFTGSLNYQFFRDLHWCLFLVHSVCYLFILLRSF